MKKQNKSKDSIKIFADLNSARKSLLNFKFQKATGQLEKTSQIRETKKKIAQLVTKINQKKESSNA